MITKERNNFLLPTILFLLYIFVFLLTELTINNRCTAVLGSTHTVKLYSIGLLCTSLGYLSFFLSHKLAKEELIRKTLIVCVSAAYMGCTLSFMLSTAPIIFSVSSLLSLLLFGYIGGFTHYSVSLFLFDKSYTGKALGIAIATATLLQFVVQNLLVVDIALIICLILSVTGIIYLAFKPIKDWMFENPLPFSSTPTVTSKNFIPLICIVAIMSLCFGLSDGLVTHLDATQMLSLTSWSRLLYALGVLAAGIIADIGKRRFLPLCTLCSLILFSTMALFLGDGYSNAANLYICVMYLFSGFYVVYITILFLDAAPMTENTSLWAGMGRIVRGPFIAFTALFSTRIQALIGEQGIAVVGIIFSLVVMLLMLFDGQLNIRAEKSITEPSHMSAFVIKHRFTPREAEIFSLLLDNDATNKDIASELLLSLRVLERYITSIYEKTGASTRIELMNLYYGKAPAFATVGESVFSEIEKNSSPALKSLPLSEEAIKAFSVKYSLTKREAQLLEQLYLRKTNEDISNELGISENTVKFHVKNLMKKLNISSRTEIRKMLDCE